MNKVYGWLLAGASSLGVIVTAGLAAHEAPKANEALEKARKEKGEDLTLWETMKIAGPCYAPAIISGGLTTGTILGNQVLNSRQQTALMMAGAVGTGMMTEYDKYRRAIKAEQGDAVDERALERAKMTEEELQKEIARLKEENGPHLYCLSTFLPGPVFEARPEDVMNAFMHFNRNLALRGYNDLGELYRFLGVPEQCYNKDEVQNYGWNDYINRIKFECSYCDFDIDNIELKNGETIRLITTPIPPYDLNIDYEDEDVPIDDHFYPLYNPNTIIEWLNEQEQPPCDRIISVDTPYLYRERGVF